MIDAPIAFAFAAGIVAAFNPCGFAMLPAYLGYFVAGDDVPAAAAERDRGAAVAVLRGMAVGAAVSAGFALVFGVAGLAITQLSLSVQRWTPWITIPIGLVMIPLGVAMWRGYEPKLALPRLNKGTSGRSLDSMFLFGVSYAVVSCSCTLPVFLAAVAGVFERESVASGMAVFLAYAGGMSLVLMVLTVALALARGSLVRSLRQVLPHVTRISGALLVLAGGYVAYYGWYSIRITNGESAPAGPVDAVTGLSADIEGWITDIGPARVGLIGMVLLTATLVIAWLLRPPPRNLDEFGSP